jgi:hypothetical protein
VFVPASPARLVVPYYDPFAPDWGYSDPEWSPWQGDLTWSLDGQELTLSSDGGYIAVAIADIQ